MAPNGTAIERAERKENTQTGVLSEEPAYGVGVTGEAIRPVVPVVSKPARPNVNCSIIVMLKIDRSGGERVPVASRYSLSRSDSYRNIGSAIFAITLRVGYGAIAVQGDSY